MRQEVSLVVKHKEIFPVEGQEMVSCNMISRKEGFHSGTIRVMVLSIRRSCGLKIYFGKPQI